MSEGEAVIPNVRMENEFGAASPSQGTMFAGYLHHARQTLPLPSASRKRRVFNLLFCTWPNPS